MLFARRLLDSGNGWLNGLLLVRLLTTFFWAGIDPGGGGGFSHMDIPYLHSLTHLLSGAYVRLSFQAITPLHACIRAIKTWPGWPCQR
jgi:hypothetical protein